MTSLTRRDFVRQAAVAVSGGALALKAAADAPAEGAPTRAPAGPPAALAKRPIIGFSKPFQNLNAEDTAAIVEEIGWSGIECPVRKGGHIEPERAADELPRFVEAFKKRGLQMTMLVTDITSIDQPHAEGVLRLAAKHGIQRLRLGFIRYSADRTLQRQLREIGNRLKDLGAACAQLGLMPGVENHSGPDLFAAPVWDLCEMLRERAINNVGICFDIGHATVEGGMCWPLSARLAAPYYTAVYVKDFTWAKGPKGWAPRWCPLGEGMIDPAYVKGLQKDGYAGPLCAHQEYPLGDRASMVAHMQRDLQVLRSWMA